MNAAVVPEKYSSASWPAQAGIHAGRSVRRGGVVSTVIGTGQASSGSFAQHLSQIALENRRRFFELIGEAGEMLQLAHRLLGLPHAVGGRVDLAAEEIGILAVDRHFGERLNLSFET